MRILIAALLLLSPLRTPGSTSRGAGAALVVHATITHKEEVWDRRSNPLMGRPDFLREIRLELGGLEVQSGRLPAGTGGITALIKGRDAIIAFRHLDQGMSGVFFLGGAGPYDLLDVAELVRPAATPKALIQAAPSPAPHKTPPFPENLKAKDLKASKALRLKAAAAIARRFGMSEAKVIFLKSFSGPMPPEGGYLYWGVSGKIHGDWKTWQPGTKTLRQGSELEDPLRYQK